MNYAQKRREISVAAEVLIMKYADLPSSTRVARWSPPPPLAGPRH
jgi:hypothetical protein